MRISRLALGLLLASVSLVTWAAAWAGAVPLIEIMSPAGQSIPEGGGPVTLDFQVKNNSGMTLLLDYAFCAITHGPPDPSDFANFSGKDGDAGLVSGALTIAAGATGDYEYSFTSPDPPDSGEPVDYGHDPVTFAIEMRPLGMITPPPIQNISSAIGFVAWVDTSGTSGTPQDPALTDILAGNNPQPNLLYSNGIIGTDANGNPYGTSFVNVFDVPEPGSISLLGAGISFLGLILRTKLR